MSKQSKQVLLISTEAPEIRVAQMHDGRLTNLFVERGGRVLNNIFKGRIANVIHGMDAAFIDIGLNRNALIYAGDLSNADPAKKSGNSIGQLVKVGDELTVQVARPPVGGKGARVTTRLSLAGRYIVLSTQDDKAGVSRRIENDDERNRLRKLAAKLRPLDHGLILRTEAEGVSESALIKDIQSVVTLLQKIRKTAESTQGTALIHREAGVLGRIVRDRLNESVAEVWLDTIEEYESFQALAQEVAPDLVDRIHFYDEDIPLLEKFGVEAVIAQAQERIVSLPHGGTLAIDETEALVAIDVNTGKFIGKTKLADTVLQTNLEAVEVAAQQIRLRNLSGVIVIDFIDMERHKDRVLVLNALEAALKMDHNRTRIVQLSPSGLIEITRRRESNSLRQLLKRPCTYCAGSGVIKSPATLAIETRKQLREFVKKNPLPADTLETSQNPQRIVESLIAVTLHPEPACAFLGPANEYAVNLEKSTGARIWLRADPHFHQEASAIEAFQNGELQDGMPPSQLKANTTIRVPVQIATFPQKEPQFIAWQDRLIHLANIRDLQTHSAKTIEIEIIAVGRWYATGKVLL